MSDYLKLTARIRELEADLARVTTERDALRAALINDNATWHRCRLPDGTVCDNCAASVANALTQQEPRT